MSESKLADELARGNGNAEDLIAANRQKYLDGLGKAQLLEADDSVELDLDQVAKAAGVKEVVSAAKRGEYVVYVSLDEDGRTGKGAVLYEDLGKKPKAAKKDEKPKDEPKKDEGTPEEGKDEPKG